MTGPIQYRLAELEDAGSISGLIIAAGGGLFEYLLEDAVAGVDVAELLRLGVTAEGTSFHHSNAVLATKGEMVVGLLLSYPVHEYGLPEIVRSITQSERLAPLETLFTSRVPNTLYVNSLAVRADARHQGIATQLLDIASQSASDGGFNGISLHVWSDNNGALYVYDQFGFMEVSRVPARRKVAGEISDGEMILLHHIQTED